MAVNRSIFRRMLAVAGSGGAGLVPCLAALGLVLLQVGAAVNLWNSRERGQFNFSPSSSLTISELLRFLIATLLLKREVRRPNTSTEYSSLGNGSEDLDLGADEDGRSSGEYAAEKLSRQAPRIGGARALWRYVWGDADLRFGLMRIALLQMLSNNLLFLNYLVSDPGTVSITKSGIMVAAALVTTPALGLKGPKTRCMAFLIQTSGLVLSQFYPQHRTRASTYQLPLYVSIVGQASFSALSDIHSEKLLKATDLSSNGANIVLGAFGAILNLLVHALVRLYSSFEPTFFGGYDSKGLSVVFMTTLAALITTVAQKRVDSWVRWFINDTTSAVLMLVSAHFFLSRYSMFLIPGTVLIFIASLAYMKYAPLKEYISSSPVDDVPNSFAPPPSYKKAKFGLLTLASFLGAGIIPYATLSELPHTPEYRLVMRDDTDGHCSTPPAEIITPFTDKQEPYKISTGPGNLTASPFSNTLAMIRWNAKRMERVPLLMKYKPFYHTVHISMPEMVEDKPEDWHNLTHSQYPHHETIYMQVARTMKLILDEQPDIEGLMYFHFDSWIDPMAWVDENRESIWFPTSHNTRQFEGDGPRYMCMTDWQKFPQWWGWYHKWNEKAVTVNGEIIRMNRGYTIEEKEFCVGWSDIFYIPRRFFADFIFLSSVYGCADLFHEVAIPTMLNIIDRSRRSEKAKFQSVIDRIGDCWGGCCDDSATAHDVKWTRCGHRLNYLNQEVIDAHYSRLDEQTAWLGQAERQKFGGERR
ncbi:hypothetical protein CNYM01_06939 [Colletotrichum nymphaeae SA-01]|uniref:UDP-galactose transporter n=1 Tax=Colletotrichum nymphaeae SA-01 TaxID=1460502 RepID=A0A135TM19_9PEZI|nr:hypothetical protein CNYM01_06939 [Colletotrichum nymphaeae SA-01]